MMALVLLGLMAVALVAMAALFAAELRRTQWAAEEAQLRQLLHAGAVAAVGDEAVASVALPPVLADEGAEVRLTRQEEAVRVEAALGVRTMEQVLRLERDEQGRWRVRAVEVVRE